MNNINEEKLKQKFQKCTEETFKKFQSEYFINLNRININGNINQDELINTNLISSIEYANNLIYDVLYEFFIKE